MTIFIDLLFYFHHGLLLIFVDFYIFSSTFTYFQRRLLILIDFYFICTDYFHRRPQNGANGSSATKKRTRTLSQAQRREQVTPSKQNKDMESIL
jgi:hypothetical protein